MFSKRCDQSVVLPISSMAVVFSYKISLNWTKQKLVSIQLFYKRPLILCSKSLNYFKGFIASCKTKWILGNCNEKSFSQYIYTPSFHFFRSKHYQNDHDFIIIVSQSSNSLYELMGAIMTRVPLAHIMILQVKTSRLKRCADYGTIFFVWQSYAQSFYIHSTY